MTILAIFGPVSERDFSQRVAGLVEQRNVDSRVVADMPAEWLGLAEASNAPGRLVTSQTIAAPARSAAAALPADFWTVMRGRM